MDNTKAASTYAVDDFGRVTNAPELALQQEVAGSNLAVPTTSCGCLADGTTHKQAVLPIL
jgi:hypothetical protein